MTVSIEVIRAMYNHLARSYSKDEARDILIQKYPESEGDIYVVEEEIEAAPAVEVEAPQEQLVKAVKEKAVKPAKVAKEKPVKAPKVAKQRTARANSKLAQARELYKDMKDMARNDIIKTFMDKLDLSKGTATVYFYSVQK